ncbi:hypothetical protein BJ138DRAFT_307203 [Hygrophoropsis aurantiaca]|uniref:Uncharacterized protein n=1 Tax=Hygrophoropsis aurantiaca TaxID=72124 RepID=A0ACB8A823_9AGAM|nr:hypothetical protein BJ138DRAFT_307203 [Hygrophoropsis aurantiaca]
MSGQGHSTQLEPAVDNCHVPLITAPPDGPVDGKATTELQLESDHSVRLDNLGPMVVNSDGTLSRIANWQHMTEPERERTMRVLAVRNKIRLEKQQTNEIQ